MLMVIDDSTQIISIVTNHSSYINWPYILSAWRCSSHTLTLHDRMCKATTPVIKGEMRDVTMEASRRRRSIWLWFLT